MRSQSALFFLYYNSEGNKMRYSKYLPVIGIGIVFISACSQSQDKATSPLQATTVKETKTEKPTINTPPATDSKPTDTKAAEEYWTKERMEKAKPPEMGVVIDPNVPQPTEPQNPAAEPGSSSGCGDKNTQNCNK
jgi:hypothetical protein